MKLFNQYIFALITVVVILASCGKGGTVGPQGPAGAQGAVGPAGPAGANGQNGSIIYSGNGAPSATTGTTGDFYLDLTSGLLYGPKTASGWGSGFSLKGPAGSAGATGATGSTGATGAAGSKIYSGTITPPAATGAIGDFYLDKTTFMLYGPKTASGWGTPLNLQGATGPQGPTGPQGSQGPAGNANVQTDEFSIGGADWLWNSQYLFETSSSSYTEYFTRYYVRLNNTVTQNVLDNGMVLAYFTPSPVNNPDQWAPLPYQFDSSFGYTYNYVYVTALGQVTLHYFFIQTDASATLPTLSTYNDEVRKFKVITVTGTTGNFMLSHHINLNDYDAVSRVTGVWQQDRK